MTIRVKCLSCGQTLKAEERHAGRTVRCPACREPVTIPQPAPAVEAVKQPDAHVDPFAEEAETRPAAPASQAAVAPKPRVQRAPAPRAAEPSPPPTTPPVDEDDIGDWLTEGEVEAPRGSQDDPIELPPQSPNWDGVSETYDLVPDGPAVDRVSAGLPPRVGKKKKKKKPSEDEDEEKPARRRGPRRGVTSSGRPWLLWVLAACLAPLAIGVIVPDRPLERLMKAAENDPELARRLDSLPETAEDPIGTLVALFPEGKLPGAFLTRETWWHYGLAALSAIGFLGLILAAWPEEEVSPGYLIGMGALTGTIGIALLLGFQFVAEWTMHFNLRGNSLIVVLFYIVKFIGFSYRCATDPSIGFGLSFMGYTFGVGFCEEMCKAVPIVLYLWSARQTTWRGATVVGFASGIGFGVSEGIMYSADTYNGLATPMIYAIRFLSCVALHTMWAGSVGLLMYRDQSHFNDVEWDDVLMFIVKYLSIAMVLHGLYDVLLKFDHELGALAIAAVTFGWLLFLVGRAQREELDAA